MKQSFELLDTESGHKVSLETTNEVLSSDQVFKLPDVNNATLATTKNIADLISDLNTGTIEPRSAKLLDGKQVSEFALADLSNVDLEGLNISGGSIIKTEQVGYNTTETVTEKRWIDGKPIYRKVLTYTPTAINTDYTINNTITSSNSLLINSQIITDQAGGLYDKNASTNGGRNYIGTHQNGVYFSILNADSVGKTHYIVLEYTKTSDTAQSPVAVLSGLDAVPNLANAEGKLLRVKNGQLEWFDNSFVGCKVVATVATSLTANTAGLIKFNDATNCKEFDTNNGFDFVNSKYVAPVAGYYEITGKVGFTTADYNRVHLYKNGNILSIGSDTLSNHAVANNVVYLNAGDTIQMYGFSNVANTTHTGSVSTYLSVSLKK